MIPRMQAQELLKALSEYSPKLVETNKWWTNYIVTRSPVSIIEIKSGNRFQISYMRIRKTFDNIVNLKSQLTAWKHKNL